MLGGAPLRSLLHVFLEGLSFVSFGHQSRTILTNRTQVREGETTNDMAPICESSIHRNRAADPFASLPALRGCTRQEIKVPDWVAFLVVWV